MTTELKRCRIRAGLLQAELAKMAGVSLSMLSRYEQGWVSPTEPTAKKIAAALHCNAGELFRIEQENNHD
jgi:transcriptional regulator with XRE-family HTH domain